MSSHFFTFSVSVPICAVAPGESSNTAVSISAASARPLAPATASDVASPAASGAASNAARHSPSLVCSRDHHANAPTSVSTESDALIPTGYVSDAAIPPSHINVTSAALPTSTSTPNLPSIDSNLSGQRSMGRTDSASTSLFATASAILSSTNPASSSSTASAPTRTSSSSSGDSSMVTSLSTSPHTSSAALSFLGSSSKSSLNSSPAPVSSFADVSHSVSNSSRSRPPHDGSSAWAPSQCIDADSINGSGTFLSSAPTNPSSIMTVDRSFAQRNSAIGFPTFENSTSLLSPFSSSLASRTELTDSSVDHQRPYQHAQPGSVSFPSATSFPFPPAASFSPSPSGSHPLGQTADSSSSFSQIDVSALAALLDASVKVSGTAATDALMRQLLSVVTSKNGDSQHHGQLHSILQMIELQQNQQSSQQQQTSHHQQAQAQQFQQYQSNQPHQQPYNQSTHQYSYPPLHQNQLHRQQYNQHPQPSYTSSQHDAGAIPRSFSAPNFGGQSAAACPNATVPLHSSASAFSSSSLSSSSASSGAGAIGCDWVGPRDRLPLHLIDCAHQVVACRFQKYGCAVRAARGDMAAHLADDVARHLALGEAKVDELQSQIAQMEGRRRRSERTSGSALLQFQYGVGSGSGNAGGSPYALPPDSFGGGGGGGGSSCGSNAGECGSSTPSYMSPPIGHQQQHQPGRLSAYGLGSSPAGSGASSMINSRNGSFNNLQGMVSGASFEHQQPYSSPISAGPATSGDYFFVGGGNNAAGSGTGASPGASVGSSASGSVNFGTLDSTNSADLSENELRLLIGRILHEHGKASVGKLGSLIHSYTNNHRLSAMCKERFGGLKKFLELHADVFAVGADHPFNPSVWLHAVHHSAAAFGGM